MQATLEPYGLELGHAENGEVALAAASTSHWDLIFLDVVMPVMDGPTALRELRARGNTTPVVLVTSVSTATVVASAIKLGGVHYIGKPFTPAQIRTVAAKLLKLAPGVLDNPPRILLQHADPDLPAQLRKLLPAHVAIDATQALAQTLDIAEATPHELVLIESRDLGDEIVAVANVIRRTVPAAGIFAISRDAGDRPWWRPEEGLDGVLPRVLDDALVRGFLYANFLRSLISTDGLIIRVAGFRGAPDHYPAFQTMVVRMLIDYWSKLDGTADLQIDLTRMPVDPELVIQLINAANDALRQLGAAPSFQVVPAVHAQVSDRLAHIVIV